MTMIVWQLDLHLPMQAVNDHDCMVVRFTFTYTGCHDHDCMVVRFAFTYTGCQ